MTADLSAQEHMQGRAQALSDLRARLCHAFERHVPHGIWSLVPPIEHPECAASLCEKLGITIEETLHEALELLAEGQTLEDLIKLDLIGAEHHPKAGEGFAGGYLQVLAEADLLLSTMNIPHIAQPVFKDPLMSRIEQEDREAAIYSIKAYSLQVIKDFHIEIHKLRHDMAAEEPEEKTDEPKDNKTWIKRALSKISKAVFGNEQKPHVYYPRLWPPLNHTGGQELDLSETHSVQDRAKAFWAEFQKRHFDLLAGNGYAAVLAAGQKKSTNSADRIATDLFDNVRSVLRPLIRSLSDETQAPGQLLRDSLRTALALVDSKKITRSFDGESEAVSCFLDYWALQGQTLLQKHFPSGPTQGSFKPESPGSL